MATIEIHQPATVGEKLLRSVIKAGIRMAVVLRAYRHRRAMTNLLSLDAHMLKDIGVTQRDVRSALAAPLSDDPSARLAALADERRLARVARARTRTRRDPNCLG
ncbi:MAG: DUF1127 domain-containing protein [Hyphomicrobiales bacterium]|nr:DUF1127 domain-containing protein [Hyphomicrobiales bacterium]